MQNPPVNTEQVIFKNRDLVSILDKIRKPKTHSESEEYEEKQAHIGIHGKSPAIKQSVHIVLQDKSVPGELMGC